MIVSTKKWLVIIKIYYNKRNKFTRKHSNLINCSDSDHVDDNMSSDHEFYRVLNVDGSLSEPIQDNSFKSSNLASVHELSYLDVKEKDPTILNTFSIAKINNAFYAFKNNYC